MILTDLKGHGCTLDKAVTDISGKDFTPGLTYAAVSRVKSLQGIMFDGPFNLPDITTKPNTDQLADLKRLKAQDAMNGPIDTDMNEELMTAKIDNDEDLSDASSEDLYGADDYCDEASATRRARGSAPGGSPKAKAWEFPSYLPIPE
ncbi:hypothetical protein E4U38_003977 [Claviceps purpurea]|nr:hypothetical protein E4U38_003977 [Claviceps purpurea]KAG6227107.1 hypothetical protein E4U26_001887 [Claviceps purpurea]KAG6263937.1 hypothetical protein E4U48_006472 [Claviceps purpurea]